MERLISFDKELLLLINGAHTDFLDSAMILFSSVTAWIPLYVIISAMLFIKPVYSSKALIYKESVNNIPMWLFGVIFLLAVLLCFGLCDQISYFFKETTCRLRPSHDPELSVRTINGLGGKYGFFSGHAANTFGLAVLTSLIFRRYWYSIPMILWAAAVSYSRMYLAKHFPLDVLCGILCGTAIAAGVYCLLTFTMKKLNKMPSIHKKGVTTS